MKKDLSKGPLYVISRKIGFRAAVIFSTCVHGGLFSQAEHTEKKPDATLWDVSDDVDFSKKSARNVVQRHSNKPSLSDREVSGWEDGWQHEEYEPDSQTIFFPATHESEKEQSQERFYSLNKAEEPETSARKIDQKNFHSKERATSASVNDNRKWSEPAIKQNPEADISQISYDQPSVHYLYEDSEPSNSSAESFKAPRVDDEKKNASGKSSPTCIGRQRVSVAPYTTSNTSLRESKRQFIGNEQRRAGDYEIAQLESEEESSQGSSENLKTTPKTISINYNNISIIEYIRFISRLTNKNFFFDESDLQFNVTIISEEPITIDNVLTTLIQELRIHGLSLIEEGDSFIIHQNDNVSAIPPVNTEEVPTGDKKASELITQVFRLNTLSPIQAQSILTPLLSKQALMGVATESRHIIITDLVTNIQKVEKLLRSIDSPNSGLVLGQYVVRNAFMDNLIQLCREIMDPIVQDQRFSLIPHPAAKSVFIVSSPFIVERTLSVLQHLDNFEGTTRIFDLEDLKFQKNLFGPDATPSPIIPIPENASTQWQQSPQGDWIFSPKFSDGTAPQQGEIPQGSWVLDPKNNWFFAPKGTLSPSDEDRAKTQLRSGETPKGNWILNPQGSWTFQLSRGEALQPSRLSRTVRQEEELPLGHIDRTKFYIQKLDYRRGEDIVLALENIAKSLAAQGNVNGDLLATIQSAQWLEVSNSIIITGTDVSITKVKELIEEIDRPLRQVMIEMLILDTTLQDSLTYGVSWGTQSGGGNTATSQAFVGGGSPLVSGLASAGVGQIPSAANLATTIGYNLGLIGQRLTHNGTQFASIGALVNAIHTLSETDIVLNPKIITEDNKTAEVFVGVNTPFLSNSIANDQGSIVTTNVEFKDTGTTLTVTPLIGNGDIITLQVNQEVSNVQSTSSTGGGRTATVNLTPTTSIERTSTTVQIPNGYFVIIGGIIQDQKVINNNQFPCLGGIPILGAAFKNTGNNRSKRNLLVFIRPEIIDTSDQFRKITKKQQDIYKEKSRQKKSWKYEVDQALDFMNLTSDCNECD